jgi:O-antigen/teichoic acid export membrane protein
MPVKGTEKKEKVVIQMDSTPRGGPNRRKGRVALGSRRQHLLSGKRSEISAEGDDDEQTHSSTVNNSIMGKLDQDEVSFRDAVDASDSVYEDTFNLINDDNQSGHWWKLSRLATTFDTILVIAELDFEMKRIFKLGFPFVLQAMAEGISEAARVAFIGRFVGTNAVAAYVVVDLVVGLTTQCLAGFQDALTTLCSHSIGAGNKKLTGQYIQMSTIVYSLCYVPVIYFWINYIDDALRWLGFDEATTKIGEDFAVLFLFYELVRGISGSIHAVLDVIGLEIYSTLFVVVQEIVAAIVTLVLALQPEPTLQTIGYAYISVASGALIVNVSVILMNGWFGPDMEGIIKCVAFLVSTTVF